jgi:integration host factor subunit alpha
VFIIKSIYRGCADAVMFGNFEVKEKAARRGRNPQTGEIVEITPRRVLTFKASQVLKKSINEA